jgi:hypothetical protein
MWEDDAGINASCMPSLQDIDFIGYTKLRRSSLHVCGADSRSDGTNLVPVRCAILRHCPFAGSA